MALGSASGLRSFNPSLLRFLHHHVRSRLVCRVEQQVGDWLDKQGVQKVCDFFLVGKLESAFKRDPTRISSVQKHNSEITHQTPFKCIGPILTTLRTFSLLRIPSLRPRVMPATLSSLVPLIIRLSTTLSTGSKHKLCVRRTFSASNADTLGFNLITETSLVFPQRRGNPRFGAGGSGLSGRVVHVPLLGLSGVVGVWYLGRHCMVCH